MTSTLEVLSRIRTGRTAPEPAGERCEMCAEPIADEHQHVVECGCPPTDVRLPGCYLLFTDAERRTCATARCPTATCRSRTSRSAGGSGRRCRSRWVSRSSSATPRWTARSRSIPGRPAPPSPSWTWRRGRRRAAIRGWACSPTTSRRCWSGCPTIAERRRSVFLVPIDACYEFVGGLRLLWRGFDGGAQARDFIDGFFAGVARAQRGAAAMTAPSPDVTFSVLGRHARAVRGDADPGGAHRHLAYRRGADPRHRAALPDPHRATATGLHRRGGRRAAGHVRPTRALGRPPSRPSRGCTRRRWCPASPAPPHRRCRCNAPTTSRWPPPSTSTLCATATDPAAVPLQRNDFRQRRSAASGCGRSPGTARTPTTCRSRCGGTSIAPALSRLRDGCGCATTPSPRCASSSRAHGLLDLDDAVSALLAGATSSHDVHQRLLREAAMTVGWDRARTVADAVLYEGYLLYPYRASSAKEPVPLAVRRARAARRRRGGVGEEGTLDTRLLVEGGGDADARGPLPAVAAPAGRAGRRTAPPCAGRRARHTRRAPG